jgi:phosphoribosyl 1,2-cyclic phosphodiesterase
VPTPDSANAGCGGNTSCVEIAVPGRGRIILDAGTGIRGVATRPGEDLDVFLTHFHWDHVQGLPFLRALADPAARVRIHAPSQDGFSTRELLGERLAPIWFPVALEDAAGRVTLHDFDPSGVDVGPARSGLHVSWLRMQHPSTTYAYRLRCGGEDVVYAPDNELAADPAAYRAVCRFAAGADLLIHDAMLTEAEYVARRGWGHSTFEQAVRLAEDAGARRLRLFHHHPERSDAAAESVLTGLRRELAQRGSTLELDLAREGESVSLS